MGKPKCCDSSGLKRGPWTPEEDQKLITFIQEHGHGSWRTLPQKAGQFASKFLAFVFMNLNFHLG